ncbi:MAG: MotA/TolQ/ExbB proton channel family protein [Blautia sp.]|nr:MotA/TolQ/ExbB proton channel family protein [Blautia sp.]
MGKKLVNLLLFLLVTAACIAMTWFIGQNQPAVMLYNFIFLGVMVVLYLAGMFGGMFRMDDVGRALQRATDEIASIFKLPGKAKASDLTALDGAFEHRFLDRKLREFSDDISKTQEGIGDVEDYINSDELDIYTHKRLMDLVPDIFTSLGILGTFLGLVWGLKNFDPNNYEAITGSVSSLVDGIKVAFLTSIYGIAFSIIYSFGAKSGYSAMQERLQMFLNRFHSYVMPSAENDSRNLLVASQKVQTDAMRQMTEQFTVSMANSFEKVITPTFQKMNNSLDTLVNSVTQVQTEAIQDILDIFMREMSSRFQLQFDDFNDALKQLKKSLTETTEYTNALYQSLSRQMSESYAQQDQAITEAVTEMGNLQNRFMATATRITQDNQNIQKQQQQDYEHVVEYMKESEQSAAKFWVACNQTMKRYVEAAGAAVDNINATEEISAQVQQENKRLIEDFNANMKEYAEYQKQSYQTMNEVKRLLQDIQVVQNESRVSGAPQPKLQTGRSDRLQQQEAIRRLQRSMEQQSAEQTQLLQEIADNINEISRQAQKGRFNLFK